MQRHVSDKAEMRQDRASAKVEKAMKDGYITRAMKDWALELCSTNEAAFDNFLGSSAPLYAHLFADLGMGGPPPARPAATVTETAESVAQQLGIDPARLAE